MLLLLDFIGFLLNIFVNPGVIKRLLIIWYPFVVCVDWLYNSMEFMISYEWLFNLKEGINRILEC